MKAENNIPTIDTKITICTKVEDGPTIHLMYELTPDKYVMDSIKEAEARLSEGDLYIAISDGCLSSSSKFNKFQIDRGGEFESESPIVAYKSVLIDNLTFAILLQYAFSFTTEK
ncbi:hypothetical protein [Bacteroides fragilis]|uniref:hypothetical protein n=1 Tax=Bacteroides fragilis TaxID=817 RepID=UPI0034A15C35